MRYLLTIILLCLVFTTNAQRLKINHKNQIQTIQIKIEKIEVKEGNTIVYITAKQNKNFSYNILFDNCQLTPNSTGVAENGELSSWNGSGKALEFSKPIRDDQEEKFTLTFPGSNILDSSSFNIQLGTLQNRKKTPIIIENIPIKK